MALQLLLVRVGKRAAAVGFAVCLTGCPSGESEPEATPDELEATGLTPLPLARFEPPSEDQVHLRNAALEAMRGGDEDTAVTALIALTDDGPRSEVRAIGALLLAQLYHRDGDVQRSLDVVDTLRAWAPPSAELEFVRGNTLLDANREADAVDSFVRATRIDPAYIRAYPTLAAVQESLGHHEGAEESLLAMERAVLRLGRSLDGDLPFDEKLDVLAKLRIGFAHAGVARAAARALDDDDDRVVAAALETLSRVGTIDVVADVLAVAQSGGPNADAAATLVANLGANGPAAD